ncbi:unnamed protein product [Lota lota]
MPWLGTQHNTLECQKCHLAGVGSNKQLNGAAPPANATAQAPVQWMYSQGGSQMNTFSSSSTQADHRTASSHRKGRTQRMSLCMSLCLSGAQRWDYRRLSMPREGRTQRMSLCLPGAQCWDYSRGAGNWRGEEKRSEKEEKRSEKEEKRSEKEEKRSEKEEKRSEKEEKRSEKEEQEEKEQCVLDV